jgi:D-3-phosphoglycerate dehydrogenase
MQPSVHVGPGSERAIEDAIAEGGGRVRPLEDADALVWLDWRPDGFPDELPERVRWVQLPAAGVEQWLDRVDGERAWTSGGRGAGSSRRWCRCRARRWPWWGPAGSGGR